MEGFSRKGWICIDRMYDIIDAEGLSIEVEVELGRAMRAYSHYWDKFQTDEGFDFDMMSLPAQRVFFRLYDDLKEANSKYYEKCRVLSENAQAGVVRRKEKAVRRKNAKKYYENNREAINSKRRSQYAKKSSDIKKSQTKGKNEAKKMSDESTQALECVSVAENSANAHRIIGLNNNPSLRSELLLERGFGGKPSYPQADVGKVQPNNNPISGLSCSKAGQTECVSSVCSKAVSGNRIAGSCGSKGNEDSKGSKAIGSKLLPQRQEVPVSCLAVSDGYSPSSSAGSLCDVGTAAKKWSERLLSAPHAPRDGEILVTRDFVIDFSDPVFAGLSKADKWLRRGVEDWVIKNKLGCSVEKRWLRELFWNFAKRQGKLNILMGVEE